MLQALRTLGLSLVPALLAACSAPEPGDAIAHAGFPILGGTASDASQDSVVRLLHNGMWVCSATLVAPNLLMTARHCVSVGEASGGTWYNCNMDGTPLDNGVFGADEDPTTLGVVVGPQGNGGTSAATGKRIYHDGPTQFCNHDFALLLLDRTVSAPISPIRLDSLPTKDESVVIVGYGSDGMGGYPMVRQQRTVKVVDVGPSPTTPLPANEFSTTEGQCFGDSGGPAFDANTKALLGVASRLFNTATCAGATNIRTTAARFKDMVLKAFADAGYSPILESGADGGSGSSGGPSSGGSGGSSGSGGSGGSTSSGGSSGSGGSTSSGGSSGSGSSSSNGGHKDGGIDNGATWGNHPPAGRGCRAVDAPGSAQGTLALVGLAVIGSMVRVRRSRFGRLARPTNTKIGRAP